MAPPVTTQDRTPWADRPGAKLIAWIVGIVSVVVAVASLVVAYLALPHDQSSAAGAPSPSGPTAGDPAVSPSPGHTSPSSPESTMPLAEAGLRDSEVWGISFKFNVAEAKVHEKAYPTSLRATGSCLNYGADINLMGKYRTFTSKVALEDTSGVPDQPIPFSVLIDGKPIRTVSVNIGEIKTITVNTSKAFRMTITTTLETEGSGCHSQHLSAVWIDPVLHQ